MSYYFVFWTQMNRWFWQWMLMLIYDVCLENILYIMKNKYIIKIYIEKLMWPNVKSNTII